MGKNSRRKHETRTSGSAKSASLGTAPIAGRAWPGEGSRYLIAAGVGLIVLLTACIYAQTLPVPPLAHDDPFYMSRNPYVNVANPFSRLGEVWTTPYFGFFTPVTTTSWLLDRAMADKTLPFDARPFRAMQLFYSVLSSCLLILLYYRLGLPRLLAVLGGVFFAVHPVHTEVVSWLAARNNLTAQVFLAGAVLAYLWARNSATPNQWRLRHASTIILMLLAILGKPVAVILPSMLIAYEFCMERGGGKTPDGPPRRALGLSVIFLLVGGPSLLIFRSLLMPDPRHGGWLIEVVLVCVGMMLAAAPHTTDLADFLGGRGRALRVLGPIFVVQGLVFGAGAAWTVWAQTQVGAIKKGPPLLPTLNMAFDVMLTYAGKMLIPARMSVSYPWISFPDVSLRGVCGVVLVVGLTVAAVWLAGAKSHHWRLVALGIFWYFIGYLPVSNLVPTSAKMADRYQFTPSAAAILAVLAVVAGVLPTGHRKQAGACLALALAAAGYTAWSYQRVRVWSGWTTPWGGKPHPDLSLWTSAVETNPEDYVASTNLALVYLRFEPPEPEKALLFLERALKVRDATRGKIPGGLNLDFSQTLQAMGETLLTMARALPEGKDPAAWQHRKDFYQKAAENLQQAALVPMGFAPLDGRLQALLGSALEGWARDLDLMASAATGEDHTSLVRQRDEQRSASEQAFHRAHEILLAGNVSRDDANFRQAELDAATAFFDRADRAPPQEKPEFYRKALAGYQAAEALFPDDPRVWLYEGLCYQRLHLVASSAQEKKTLFERGEAVLRKALTLHATPDGYDPLLPYRALATIHFDAGDYGTALDLLKQVRQMDASAGSTGTLDQDIQTVERMLTK
jgi:hypothetical protein